jgi:hypothetical protein
MCFPCTPASKPPPPFPSLIPPLCFSMSAPPAAFPHDPRTDHSIRGATSSITPQCLRPSGRPGATERELDSAERELGVSFPAGMRVLYRMRDGQDLQFDSEVDTSNHAHHHASIYWGIFGAEPHCPGGHR